MKRLSVFLLCAVSLISGMILAQERKLQLKKLITITSPKEGDTFKTTDPILVSWTSEGITGMLKGSLLKYQQAEVQTYGNNLKPTGSLTIPAGRIMPGKYIIRLQEVNGNVKGESGAFTVILPIKPEMKKREPQTIEVTIPVQKRDRHSKREQSYDWNGFSSLPTEPQHPSTPTHARVGFENHYTESVGMWFYIGFIYRSRLFFDVSQFVGKKGILLEAMLKLTNHSTDSDYPGISSCGHQLYVLTSVWEKPIKCIETPGYFYKNIPPNQNDMTIDVQQQVQSWISGAEVNHGFLLTGVNELWNHNNQQCVSYYSAELYIKFREYY